jgi:hypothetical protein
VTEKEFLDHIIYNTSNLTTAAREALTLAKERGAKFDPDTPTVLPDCLEVYQTESRLVAGFPIDRKYGRNSGVHCFRLIDQVLPYEGPIRKDVFYEAIRRYGLWEGVRRRLYGTFNRDILAFMGGRGLDHDYDE